MGTSNKARIWAVIGSSGCGKGLWMKEQLRKLKPSRLIIMDTKDENGEFADLCGTLNELARATFKPTFRVRYIPKGESKKARMAEFEAVCRIASAAGNCTYLVEELGRYTMPSYAPPAWADCCNDGRHDGLHLIAASQFPAQIDKSFLGNATLIHCGFVKNATHRKVMAEEMDIDPDQIKALPNLHYLDYDLEKRTVTAGKVAIPKR
jgi:hypothetical protein